jgi:hypothetical protein
MLNNLSENIRNCLQHAEDCGRKAAELPNVSPLRQDFLRLEKRWLELARSFEFGESLDTFFCAKASPFMVNGNPNKLCSPIFNPFRPPRRGRATEQPSKAAQGPGFVARC